MLVGKGKKTKKSSGEACWGCLLIEAQCVGLLLHDPLSMIYE
jgi:hypothetical protein